ncbi:MAG: hypothetical protein WC956_00560 [bacterium]
MKSLKYLFLIAIMAAAFAACAGCGGTDGTDTAQLGADNGSQSPWGTDTSSTEDADDGADDSANTPVAVQNSSDDATPPADPSSGCKGTKLKINSLKKTSGGTVGDEYKASIKASNGCTSKGSYHWEIDNSKCTWIGIEGSFDSKTVTVIGIPADTAVCEFSLTVSDPNNSDAAPVKKNFTIQVSAKAVGPSQTQKPPSKLNNPASLTMELEVKNNGNKTKFNSTDTYGNQILDVQPYADEEAGFTNGITITATASGGNAKNYTWQFVYDNTKSKWDYKINDDSADPAEINNIIDSATKPAELDLNHCKENTSCTITLTNITSKLISALKDPEHTITLKVMDASNNFVQKNIKLIYIYPEDQISDLTTCLRILDAYDTHGDNFNLRVWKDARHRENEDVLAHWNAGLYSTDMDGAKQMYPVDPSYVISGDPSKKSSRGYYLSFMITGSQNPSLSLNLGWVKFATKHWYAMFDDQVQEPEVFNMYTELDLNVEYDFTYLTNQHDKDKDGKNGIIWFRRPMDGKGTCEIDVKGVAKE